MGNSVLESLCNELIDHAKEHPSRSYVMVSSFTKEAMEDALETLEREPEGKPANIFLTLEDFAKFYATILFPNPHSVE